MLNILLQVKKIQHTDPKFPPHDLKREERKEERKEGKKEKNIFHILTLANIFSSS